MPVELDPGMRAARETVAENSAWIRPLQQEIGRVIVGQTHLLDTLLIALLTNGHVLLEGVPGLAKTLALKTLASCVAVRFKRLQFTPDMLPADIVGTMIYNPQDGEFRTKHGPIFSNLILADEINRAPAKVQSALLEAMQETAGDDRRRNLRAAQSIPRSGDPESPGAGRHLPASRSADRSIHDEGHRQLSEPHRRARHSGCDGDHRTDDRTAPRGERRADPRGTACGQARSTWTTRFATTSWIWCSQRARRLAASLNLNGYIQNGASPRATIALTLAARAMAFLKGRHFVIPQDVKSIALDVLRHRVSVTYEAEAENITSENVIEKILNTLPVP